MVRMQSGDQYQPFEIQDKRSASEISSGDSSQSKNCGSVESREANKRSRSAGKREANKKSRSARKRIANKKDRSVKDRIENKKEQ